VGLWSKLTTKKEAINGRRDISLHHPSPAAAIQTGNSQEPVFGAAVYYRQDSANYSGIYIGRDHIIQLSGTGRIEKVYLQDLTTEVWFPCIKESGQAAGLCTTGYIALEMLDNGSSDQPIIGNCHQFTSGCITSNFENGDHTLEMVKHTFAGSLDFPILWKKWERQSNPQAGIHP